MRPYTLPETSMEVDNHVKPSVCRGTCSSKWMANGTLFFRVTMKSTYQAVSSHSDSVVLYVDLRHLRCKPRTIYRSSCVFRSSCNLSTRIHNASSTSRLASSNRVCLFIAPRPVKTPAPRVARATRASRAAVMSGYGANRSLEVRFPGGASSGQPLSAWRQGAGHGRDGDMRLGGVQENTSLSMNYMNLIQYIQDLRGLAQVGSYFFSC